MKNKTHKQHAIKNFIIILLTAILVSCGGAPSKPKPTIDLSVNQIQQIRNFDELLQLLKRLNKGLTGKNPQTHAEDFATRVMIENQLIDIKKDQLSTLFSSSRHSSGVIPLQTLTPALEKTKSITDVDQAKWSEVIALINNELIKTNTLITQSKAAIEHPETNDKDKLAKMTLLSEITGDPQWQVNKHQLLDGLVAQIRAARDAGEYNDTIQRKVELIRRERQDNTQLVDEMIGINASIYEQRFFTALSNADPDKAYESFVAMSESDDFPAMKEKLSDTTQKMAALFSSMADESVQDPEQISQSYRWYSQAKFINGKLNIEHPTTEGEKTLIQQLQQQAETAKNNKAIALALAYHYMINDFQADYKNRKAIRELEDKLRLSAIKKVSTTDFKNSAMRHDYGSVMSSAITQHLFKKIPNDVRIIEREQYEAIIREKSLSGEDNSELDSVDLIVTGSVLESKVDSTEAKGKKMMRVVVGKETIPNPAYISWLELDSRDRKDIAKPRETIDVDQKENISIVITQHRKVGIFSVSFRLVDAHNGKIILPDSLTMEEEHTDNSSEGVEMGEFILPFKLAELPSDVEILDDLAKKISAEIGSRLAKHLENQEQRYIDDANHAKKINSCLDEIEALGKSLMIYNVKEMESEKIMIRYKNAAINCPTG